MPTARYNCSKCPGYCCSYPIIPLTKTDLKRLARHFGLGVRAAAAKFTVTRGEDKYTMRRKADPHFGRVCQFFDTKQRNCTIYAARPSACRTYPNKGRCGYYEFLQFERWLQDDPDFVATTR
jgi:Fe-S-cluster containining protein